MKSNRISLVVGLLSLILTSCGSGSGIKTGADSTNTSTVTTPTVTSSAPKADTAKALPDGIKTGADTPKTK